MKRILNYVLKRKVLVIIPVIAMLLSIILDMFNPYFSKIMVEKVITNKELSLLPTILISVAGISIGRAILGYVKEFLADYLATEVSKDMKAELFDHIQSLPYSYFDSMNTGELMSRIGEDVDNIWRTVSFGFRLFIENGLYFIIASSILFYLNWILALACIVIMVPIAFISMRLEKVAGETYGKISDQAAEMNTVAQENISGVRLVKAFAREKHEILKFLKMNETNYKLNVEQTNIFSKFFPQIEFLTNIVVVFMICLGGILVIKGNLTLGTLVAFSGYIWMLIWPMRMLGWLTNMIAQNNASAIRIFKILDTKAAIKSDEDSIVLEEIKGSIKFDNVTFKYNDEIVLKNINLEVAPGATIALMGTTGSGKTSIINLIGRYYDVMEGSISIDGHDVKNINLESLRSKMSVVSQDVFLFSESVKDNIRLGKPEASIDTVIEACREACADEFIRELEDGYETIIGERGIGLSGGQKQRISIARALIREASILILDDASSALDMETEYSLLKNLKHRKKKPTTFIIAHRISAVKNADKIAFLENGCIVESGTHEQLLKLKGKYYEIYCEQFKDFEDLEGEVV
ncbi:MAG: ABC transporter ATP-binding protein [Clostridiaceae bacterium]|nr:ABC transporter ATP-binding protein [Clostridiaceae bacterium]